MDAVSPRILLQLSEVLWNTIIHIVAMRQFRFQVENFRLLSLVLLAQLTDFQLQCFHTIVENPAQSVSNSGVSQTEQVIVFKWLCQSIGCCLSPFARFTRDFVGDDLGKFLRFGPTAVIFLQGNTVHNGRYQVNKRFTVSVWTTIALLSFITSHKSS